ncbi:MAG: lipoyl(octanoyl) transferase LipB, partial [Candidatus Eremiobacteraeota bacterium]|nr:lipoyl(octanoyl) transferase LipB [Candidatus Eremiobacteraeota bacterium]
MNPTLLVRMGLVDYDTALELQERLVAARKSQLIGDVLLLLRHPNVITLGRAASGRYLKSSPEKLAEDGYPVVEAGRGGEVTFHGPGQLVSYPVLQLEEEERDLHLHLRRLEQVGIEICADFGLNAHRVVGRTGVWLGRRKVAAIGVRARSWVTFHGMAFNLTDELEGFNKIVPCGIDDAEVGCLETLAGR